MNSLCRGLLIVLFAFCAFDAIAQADDYRTAATTDRKWNYPESYYLRKALEKTSPTSERGNVKRESWILRQPDTNYAVQVFTSNSEAMAKRYISAHSLGEDFAMFKVSVDGVIWYKALHGSFATRREAEAVRDEMRRVFSDESPWLRNFLDIKNEINGVRISSGSPKSGHRTLALDSGKDIEEVSIALSQGQSAFNRQQYGDALRAWLPLARMDVAEAQYGIGFMYESGWGVAKDFAAAFEWYYKAAQLDHAKSQYNLGMLYLNGRGVGKDEKKGRDWILKAAAKNDRRALEYMANAAIDRK